MVKVKFVIVEVVDFSGYVVFNVDDFLVVVMVDKVKVKVVYFFMNFDNFVI